MEEKKGVDCPELKFIHLCERFWFQQETGMYDILGCFDRIRVPLDGRADLNTAKFSSNRGFFIVLGVSGIKAPEACKVEITHINTGLKEYEASQFITNPDPLNTTLVIFGLKKVAFTGMGSRSVDVMMGRQLVGGMKLKVEVVETSGF